MQKPHNALGHSASPGSLVLELVTSQLTSSRHLNMASGNHESGSGLVQVFDAHIQTQSEVFRI